MNRLDIPSEDGRFYDSNESSALKIIGIEKIERDAERLKELGFSEETARNLAEAPGFIRRYPVLYELLNTH